MGPGWPPLRFLTLQYDTGEYSDDLFKYSTVSMTWTKLVTDAGVTGTPSARDGHSMATVGQDIYMFGGYDGE